MKYITILCTSYGEYLKSGNKYYCLLKPINSKGKCFAMLRKLWMNYYEIIKLKFLDSMDTLDENIEVRELLEG